MKTKGVKGKKNCENGTQHREEKSEHKRTLFFFVHTYRSGRSRLMLMLNTQSIRHLLTTFLL